jgi:2-keto-4-pentenoate hydratase/2-oxohepta-3-ene-1,7-dioic acid hydratase in catechol pathway
MVGAPGRVKLLLKELDMRWCRFRAAERTCWGIVDGLEVIEVRGNPFEHHDVTSIRRPLDRVKLLLPCLPKTFYAAGLNYVSHIKETAEARGEKFSVPEKPDIGYRANNALIAHDEPIIIPRDASDEVQYEGELVAIIGKEVRRVSEEDALDCVMGYTIGNDVSERSWQRSDRSMWRSKNTDSFKPMGPWIETNVTLHRLKTTVRLNGEVVSEFPTNDMIFGVATYISAMSQNITLYPGDMIWMGTDGPTHNMKGGDVVEVEIRGIGTLRNPLIQEE